MAIYVAPDRINIGWNQEFGCFTYGRSLDSGNSSNLYWKVANVTGGSNRQFRLDLIGQHQGYGSTDTMGHVTIFGEFQNGNSNNNLQLGGYYLNQMPTIIAERNGGDYNFNIWVQVPAFSGADILFTSADVSATLYDTITSASAPSGYSKTANFKAL
jgi:hypothetical protein